MRKIIISLFLLLMLLANTRAGEVSVRDARQVAVNFYYERLSQYRAVDYRQLEITGTYPVQEEGQILYYIFNINNEGYVIVSAMDDVVPALAYSFESTYSPDAQAPQFKAWVEQYSRQIRHSREIRHLPTASVSASWQHLLTRDPRMLNPVKETSGVSPLIWSNWDQGNFYNEYCPADPQGPGGHAYAGCVPTAMGQIMYYYRWPDHGTGSYTDQDPKYGPLYANFDSTWYDWNNMKNSITRSNHGIAELLYNLGVSCDLRYGPDGSGMYNHKSAYALRTFFRYSPETQYVFRDSTNLKWDSIILAHLDRGMPLYYAGWSVPNVNGHAFVCDGYQTTDYFHFNFGWSGSSNGYFYLDTLIVGGNNFNLAQELIINIYPDTLNHVYPQYCNGFTHLRTTEGSIEDGSGPLHNYQPGGECSWLIDPQTETDSITKITLTFDYLATNATDVVTVYDGGTTAAPVLGSFSGTNKPPVLNTTGNKMLLLFQRNSGMGAPGWSATYTTTSPSWCKTVTPITADTLDLTDGSFGFNYHNNTNCRWNLSSKSGDTLTVYFKEFDTEPGKDLVRIYDAETMDTLAILSGHYDSPDLPQPVSSPSGKMLILFLTNSTVTGKGWHLYYPKSTVGLVDRRPEDHLRVFPNPAKGSLTVQYTGDKMTDLGIELRNVEGVMFYEGTMSCLPGRQAYKVDISGFVPGVYLLIIKNNEFTKTEKIIISK